jgi:putative chitinase
MLTEQQLKEMIPRNKYVSYWHKALEQLLPDYDINTPKRIAAFVAQCAHESAEFTVIQENLNYKASALRRLFPKYFPTDELAEQYASKPNKQQAIANRIYANRMGNGDESSGDGFAFRGRGLIQLTGKTNVTNFADSISITPEEAIEYLETFEGAAQSACFFWEQAKLNEFADKGDILTLTKRINGGTIGLNDRIKHYNHALKVMEGGH